MADELVPELDELPPTGYAALRIFNRSLVELDEEPLLVEPVTAPNTALTVLA